MTLPPIPPGCPHFAKHDFGNGKGSVDIFWCSEPFWSHDHGEPWLWWLDDALSPMQRNTIASVAHTAWREIKDKLEASIDENTNTVDEYTTLHIQAAEAYNNLQAWLVWRDAK